jgi:hypothetical protein
MTQERRKKFTAINGVGAIIVEVILRQKRLITVLLDNICDPLHHERVAEARREGRP